jgi:hypothetical protein
MFAFVGALVETSTLFQRSVAVWQYGGSVKRSKFSSDESQPQRRGAFGASLAKFQ